MLTGPPEKSIIVDIIGAVPEKGSPGRDQGIINSATGHTHEGTNEGTNERAAPARNFIDLLMVWGTCGGPGDMS